MTHLDEKSLKKLETLCKIKCTEEEEEKLLINLEKILVHMGHLEQINTEGVPPCHHVLEGITMPLREDLTKDTIDRDTLLTNCPSQIGGMVKVPKVMKETEH